MGTRAWGPPINCSLRAAGVHSMQGDRFGKAVSVAEITARLQSPSAFQPTELAALTS
jgi:hypothetical protein